MKLRDRFYFYSDRHLTYHEVRWFKTKLAGTVLAAATIILAVVMIVNHYSTDFLGLGYNRIELLSYENQVLRTQLHKMTGRVEDIEKILDRFAERNNELRLMVNLPRLDEDTRTAGAGGKENTRDYGLSSSEMQSVLNNAQTVLDKLLREIELQKQSYGEINMKYKYNQGLFANMPALKPMDGYYSSSGFGLRMHPVLGIYKTHEGLDIVSDVGTPVYAAGDGVVEYSAHSGGGYGMVIVINHGYGYQTLYAHMSKLLVREGRQIKRGDLIGRSGNTGLVSGPHLHYEVRLRGVKQNPIDFFLDDLRPEIYRSQLAKRN